MPKIVINKKRHRETLETIDEWEGKLTWDLLIVKLKKSWRIDDINRHTLRAYPDILLAFQEKKKELRTNRENSSLDTRKISQKEAEKTIRSLRSQVARLERENNLLNEKFVRWQKNVYMTPGTDITSIAFDKPLPATDRK